MNKKIAFINPNETTNSAATASLWAQPKRDGYEDLLLKPEYSARKLRFNMGANWFRIVPAIEPSAHGWMLPVHTLNYPGGRYAHPRTLRQNVRSAFDHAYGWIKANNPASLFSKANKEGVRLLTDPTAVCWVIAEESGKLVSRLLVASGYNAARGGAAGLGYQIWKASREFDENDKLVADASDPALGTLVCVEKSQPTGSKFASYAVRVGRQPCPIDGQLAKMDAEEIDVLCPLENVIQDLPEEEQWKRLGRCIAPDNVETIRASLREMAQAS